MATVKSRSRSLAFPSDITQYAVAVPGSSHCKGPGVHSTSSRRMGGHRSEKSVRTPGRSPVKDAATAEMLDKPLTIKSIKKVAKAERRKLKETATQRYIQRVEKARKHYERSTARSREAFEKAKEDAREEMEQLVNHAKDKYQFTVEMARDITEDSIAQDEMASGTEPPIEVSENAQSYSVEEELRQAVLGG